jgi:hypothetical protein
MDVWVFGVLFNFCNTIITLKLNSITLGDIYIYTYIYQVCKTFILTLVLLKMLAVGHVSTTFLHQVYLL